MMLRPRWRHQSTLLERYLSALGSSRRVQPPVELDPGLAELADYLHATRQRLQPPAAFVDTLRRNLEASADDVAPLDQGWRRPDYRPTPSCAVIRSGQRRTGNGGRDHVPHVTDTHWRRSTPVAKPPRERMDEDRSRQSWPSWSSAHCSSSSCVITRVTTTWLPRSRHRLKPSHHRRPPPRRASSQRRRSRRPNPPRPFRSRQRPSHQFLPSRCRSSSQPSRRSRLEAPDRMVAGAGSVWVTNEAAKEPCRGSTRPPTPSSRRSMSRPTATQRSARSRSTTRPSGSSRASSTSRESTR